MSELISTEAFHAPVSRDLLGSLLDQYQGMRRRIEAVANLVESEAGSALSYFLQGNADRVSSRHMPGVAELFKPDGAVSALNSDFWRRTLALTDVYECMPQARRDEWDKQIMEMTAPEFTEDAVLPTIEALLLGRSQFLAERVDGIFRGLSGTHVTNSPMAFNSRMILSYVFSDWGGVQHSRSGLISDLRCVIARFMGRDEPRYNSTGNDLARMRLNTGVWHTLDGGALRIRVYKIGTAHLEVHPDMAWRLNAILHTLHPRAIPASQRVKPPKASKVFKMMQRPLPFAVVHILDAAKVRHGALTFDHYYTDENKPAAAEAARVIESIGGVKGVDGTYHFDYDPADVINGIVMSGCIPDKVSHQYYPTPETVARVAVEMAQIGPAHLVLEPSAGQGGIADLLPKAQTVCVEVSPLHCRILEAKGYQVSQGDFIEWAKSAQPYHRIVMNPPYSEGRWLTHVQAAARLLPGGGRLVAVLPASARGKELIPGYTHEWSRVFEGEFAGTSVDVAIIALERAP